MGFKAVTTSFGESALELAHEIQPAAITLDLRLPDMDGWVVLDRLKHDPSTRHIPVHVISVDDSWQRGMKLGAFAFLKKPVSRQSLDDAFSGIRGFLDREVRRLLVVEDNDLERANIVAAIGDGDVQTTAVGTAAEALEALRAEAFDCLVLDLGLPDMGGLELLETDQARDQPPGAPGRRLHRRRDLTPEEQARLDVLAETTIVKDVRSMEHLVDKTALFLHRVEAKLRPATRQMLHQGQQVDPDLAGKRVLIVDDDLRNIFALTSKLERWELVVLRAENGRQALDLLTRTPDVDLVLMDIMMPEMDGYETMRAIRERAQFRSLPIIALTAKAMREDRQKCIEAGASDYLAKPVSSEQLLSMLRVWLYRKQDQGDDGGLGDGPRSSRARAGPAAREPDARTGRNRVVWLYWAGSGGSVLDPERRGHGVRAQGRRPAGGRPAEQPARPGGHPGRHGPGPRARPLRRGGADARPRRRLRRHPDGRPDAGHGRVRDGRADPRARPLAAHPDHLPDRLPERRGPGLPGVQARGGRLPLQADRADRAAVEGRGLRRAVPEGRAGEAPGGPAPREPAAGARAGAGRGEAPLGAGAVPRGGGPGAAGRRGA